MTEERLYLDYLRDIRENAEIALELVKGMTYEQFANDVRTKYAVVRALEIIGEAAKHVSAEVRKRYPGVPWSDMAGMRDRLIHQYAGILYDVVWHTATARVRDILPRIESAIREEEAKRR